MKRFLGAGTLSAVAILFLGLGDSSAALAQQVRTTIPVVQAVVSNPSLLPNIPLNIFTKAPEAASAAVLPLRAMVDAHSEGPALDEEGKCLATAVYFESMGEPLEGQLAVAQVVMNRASSGRYPTSWCAVVKQKAQFSFVRSGRFPRVDSECQAWRKAQAIARIAAAKLAGALPDDVLWYHADYVAPSWGRRLTRVEKIGAHIFYRA